MPRKLYNLNTALGCEVNNILLAHENINRAYKDRFHGKDIRLASYKDPYIPVTSFDIKKLHAFRYFSDPLLKDGVVI